MCVGGGACVFVCVVSATSVPVSVETRRQCQIHRNWTTGGCEQPGMVAGDQSDLLKVLFTVEASL